jgi:hypothetical protein
MIESDDQAGFFNGRIPSPPHQTSVWFHKKEGKTTVSSLIIPLSFFGLSYPFRPILELIKNV